MDLDRGTLARIDRKLLAGLHDAEVFRMVRVPVTPAQWSTWKRYCDTAGVSMGRAITSLIEHELLRVFGGSTVDEVPILVGRADERLAAREARVDARENAITAAEERLRRRTERLRLREDLFQARAQRAEVEFKLSAHPTKPMPRVGRNEPCPCGSGVKYKRCHG
jgi:hypothetical protein